MATSLSQYNITWYFSGDYNTGKYANGDYYVVSSSGVVITGINPPSTLISGRVINGAMVNPQAAQYPMNGFDSALSNYFNIYNVARPGGNDLSSSNPLILATGSSLISVTSHPTAGFRPQFYDAAVLTIVGSTPPSGSLRPPYCGTDKTHRWNKTGLNYSILGSYPTVSGAPADASYGSTTFQRPWIEICTSDDGREWHPEYNQPIYGRDMAVALSDSLLALHLNFTNAQKEQSYINICQYGLDVYGAARTSGDWVANGGFNSARKLPLILAGLAFNDTGILWYGNKDNFYLPRGFQEDQQTFIVSTGDVNKFVDDQYVRLGRLRLTYTSGMTGLPEWGVTHMESFESSDASNWSAIYRSVNSPNYSTMALAAGLISGGYAAWNNSDFFNFADRAIHIEGPDAYIGGSMWYAYRKNSQAPIWTPVAPVATPAFIPISGNKIVLGFSDNVKLGNDGINGLTITASSGTVTVTGSPTNGLDPDWPTQLEKSYGLSRTIGTGEIVTISYIQPGDGLKALTGSFVVPNFTSISVNNYSTIIGTGGGGGGGIFYRKNNVNNVKLKLFKLYQLNNY